MTYKNAITEVTLITEARKIRTAKEVEVVIRKREGDRDHERDTVRIAAGAVEEKSKGKEARKDETEAGATKEETLAEAEKLTDIEAAVKIEAGTNIREIEAEVKRGSMYCCKLFQIAE